MKLHLRSPIRVEPRAVRVLGLSLAASAAAASAHAQATNGITVFSIDYRSITVSVPDTFTGAPITEGDVLAAAALIPQLGPLPVPGTLETGGVAAPQGLALGLHGPCVGHLPGTPCGVDVDALSHGMDRILGPTIPGTAGAAHIAFSVGLRSIGVSGFPPDVWDEGQCLENSADVYVAGFLPPAPVAPFPGINFGIIDGNGLANCTGTGAFPGVGLVEPNLASNPGDNIDALDMDVPDAAFPRTTCSFFSLDGLIFDPVTLVPGSGSAQAHGFLPGDVLVTNPGGVPQLYAGAMQLGLDLPPLLPGSDDLDALILCENGINGYQRSTVPYDWTTGASDMLLFSVRRGSALIGTPDSFFGLPIQPGDILTPTGALGTPPGIWIAAEALGLVTFRPNPSISNGDEVDGLDSLQEPDAGTPFCGTAGTIGTCPCGNNGFPGRGCGNSVNAAGAILWGNGFPSISNDTVILHASGMPATATCLLYQGTTALGSGVVFGDGLRCVGGVQQRFPLRTAWCGNRSFGNGVPGDPSLSVYFGITSPTTLHYQVWYRDSAVFCTPNVFNLSNGYRITWVP